MTNEYYIFHLIICILALVRVRKDCKTLGENWGKYVLPILMFSWVFYLLWLYVWPGSLKLWFQGKRLEDSSMARLVNRNR